MMGAGGERTRSRFLGRFSSDLARYLLYLESELGAT